MATPEGKVKTWVKRQIENYNVEWRADIYTNWPVPGGYGESMLDCVGCAYGKFFMIEAKAPGKKPTLRQEQCAARVERAKGKVFVVDHVGDPRMKEFLVWVDRMRLLQDYPNEVDQEGRIRVRV